MAKSPQPVFETLLVIDGQVIEASGHLGRLREATGVDASEFLQLTAAQLSGYHRLRIDYGGPQQSLKASSVEIAPPTLFQGVLSPVKLVTAHLTGQRGNTGLGPFKSANRQELERLETEVAPAFPLLLDSSNQLLETSRHNIFIMEGETLTTPPLDGRILPGVTRRAVLEEASQLGLDCREAPISLAQALAADGMFVTSAIIGIGWVEQCDDTTWVTATPVIKHLHEAVASRWHMS